MTLSYPKADWEIVSALAEGADCLFVEEAMKQLRASLIVVLPLPADDYLREFRDASDKKSFGILLSKTANIVSITTQSSRDKSYLEAGRYIVNHCDILIIIWDGRKAQGVGGTGDIVKIARRKSLPMAWIRAGNRQPGTNIPVHLGEAQGMVILEHFPEIHATISTLINQE